MASYGLLKGVGTALTKTADDIGERLRRERIQQFQMNMQQRGWDQQAAVRQDERAYQDRVREEQQGLLMQRDAQQRALELQDQARQDSNVASWGTAIDGDTQYQVGYSRTGEEVARHEAGPVAQPDRSNAELVRTGGDEYGSPEQFFTYDPSTNTMVPVKRPQPQYEPPQEAIQELRESVTDDPSVIEEFNAKYGQGAADRYLRQPDSETPPSGGNEQEQDETDGGGVSDSGQLPEDYTVEPSMMQRAGSAISGLLQSPEKMGTYSESMRTGYGGRSGQEQLASDVQRVKELLKKKMLPRDLQVARAALDSGQLSSEEERVIRQYLDR